METNCTYRIHMKAPGATWTWLNRQNNMEAMHNKTNMKSTMCWTAGNTHFCTCSCGHGGLEVTKAWVIAPVGHIPEVVLVALVYVTGPGSDTVKNWDASLCIPNSWRTARWTHLFLLPCCNLGAFGFGHGSGAITWATCSWCLQQHMVLETNVSKWQCKQLGIPPALGTGATPARLLSSVANIYCQKTGLNHLGDKDLTSWP